MDIIEFKQVSKSFGSVRVFDGLDLTVRAGESTIIIGRSGCGKSVMLKHMVGLIRPDSGHVFVAGDDITHLSERELFRIRRKFGVLFQGAALLDSLTVEENVALGLVERSSYTPVEIQRIVTEKLDMVGMPGTQNIMPAELSGGMKKRVGLSRAIAMNPEIILYDEPTTGLDPIMADVINDMILRLKETLHTTTIVVTHDMFTVRKVADRVAMLENGKIVFSGTIEELENSDIPVVRQFIGNRCEFSPSEKGALKHP